MIKQQEMDMAKEAMKEAGVVFADLTRRGVHPITAANACAMASVGIFALEAESLEHLEVALQCVANVARTYALDLFMSKRRRRLQ